MKLILYLDSSKDIRFDDALGSLKYSRLFDALSVHVSVGTSQWIVGRK
jgi:hypothetical protein